MADHKRGRGELDGDEIHPRGDEEGDSECKSAKAIRLLREVTTVLKMVTGQTRLPLVAKCTLDFREYFPFRSYHNVV